MLQAKEQDSKNIEVILAAQDANEIDENTCKYLTNLYTDSIKWFRNVFLCIGKCFGAPKAPVMQYDYDTDSVINKKITISDINPQLPYLTNHRLDEDPMRNQFFTTAKGHKIDLAVSSIITVIVGAQKNVHRALDKITGKYYDDYIEEVAKATYNVIIASEKKSAADAVVSKIRDIFRKSFITDASSKVLEIIGSQHHKISANLVRELDKIRPPYARLEDVWRVKCLFDLVPQARTFIERVCAMWPDKTIEVRDRFFDITNPRGYRDAKIILNMGTKDNIVPLEIICQVRTFFEFEHQTHDAYEKVRLKSSAKNNSIESVTETFHIEGVKKYNNMIYECVDDLFDRIGWNILYSDGNDDMLFDGFPKISTIYYPSKISDIIFDKVDNAVENEVFVIQNAPIKLTKDQEIRIFRWMAKFILITAMPYSYANWSINTATMAGKFFNFIMKELHRYYKK